MEVPRLNPGTGFGNSVFYAMRISFDIDDTIIFYDKTKNGKDRLLNGEYLRCGTLSLFKELQRDHDLLLYTASLRSPWLLKLSFWLKGIKLSGVINQDIHDSLKYELKLQNFPTKYPSKFGIDLHVDNSKGVVLEGEKYGFKVLLIDEEDKDWIETVKEGINSSL